MDWQSQGAATRGVNPDVAAMTLAEYGTAVMKLALRGLARKTTDPYLAGWHKRVVPVLGHLPIGMISNGMVDRAIKAWIADGVSRSTVKNSLAVLVLVVEQAVRDEIIERNPARVFGSANTKCLRTRSTILAHSHFETFTHWRHWQPHS